MTPRPAQPVVHRLDGAVVTEREHVVPLDHADPSGPSLVVFTREVVAPGGEDRPYLVFFQGGPGIEATRPTSPPTGWMARALADYRVLLLDQRGTGRSSPVGSKLPGTTAEEGARFLTRFRADSIVRDAEAIRRELGVDRWSILGQSFGGFCAQTYLSIAPEGLREAFITGGIAPLAMPVRDIYALTYERCRRRNARYFERYPGDRARLRELCRRADDETVLLPSGDRLSGRRIRALGLALGDSAGFEQLHHILELPWGSAALLADLDRSPQFARNPLYATLQEAAYADGVATGWAGAAAYPADWDEEGLFTGEHLFPWMWEEIGGLRGHAAAADLLASHPWPRLYDEDRLARNEVPVATAIYTHDMYVDRDLAVATATRIGACRIWETDEYEHNGLRADGERVLGRLIDLVRGG